MSQSQPVPILWPHVPSPRMSLVPAFLLTATLFSATLSADELRLEDGRVLVGKVVEKKDTWEVTTREGVVIVPKSQVKAPPILDDELRRNLAAKARAEGDTAFAHLNLAREAREHGLEPEMWRHLDRALMLSRAKAAATATDPEVLATGAKTSARDPLQRRIEDFLAQLEPELLPRKWRTAATKVRVHELLDLLRADTGSGRTAAIEELLVREQNADQDLRTEARRNGADRRRIGALAALQRRELAGNDRFVLRTAILDCSKDVRAAAIDLGRASTDGEDVAYLAAGLMHSNPKVRVRTAEAFGELGHPDAVKLLVLAGPNAGVALAAADQGVRGHVAFLTQQAYIRDYDVEVAQAAFIADPKVDVLQSGTVLDVTVAGVYEVQTIVRTYRAALKQLTQQDPGSDPRAWSGWLANLPEPGSVPTTGRR